MEKGDIVRARWIKPAARWAPHQTCEHTIFTFQTSRAMNEVLVNGMFVQQKKIYVEKCKREPLRCLKCHGWGHMVHDCIASVDTCEMCTQRHRTDTCTNTAWPHCVSCGTVGHATWAQVATTNKEKSAMLKRLMFPIKHGGCMVPAESYGDQLPSPPEIMESQVRRHIAKLSPHKAPGADSIPNIVIKMSADIIMPHLLQIFHTTIHMGVYAEQWKEIETSVL